ncbi:MAG TPA: glycosyltransferase family 9 protein, partial [Burkholderiales bacterium]|nr:glycosyltransferase family 9 protein [Burkholderiales bacterium]
MSTPRSPLIAPPESICVLRLSAIGDVCHTVPVVHALQRRWPAARITWVIGRMEASLVGDLPGVEFITYDKSGGLAAWRALRATLRHRRFDWLLHMQAALRASLVSLAISARTRLGFDRARARDFQWLFTNRKIEARPGEHVMDGLLGFAEALDAPRTPL